MSKAKIVTNCEKKFLLNSLGEWSRIDGRAFDEFRKLTIEFGKDWGCCNVTLGKTRVVAQVSCEIQQPKSSRPSEGVLNINIELNPIASPEFEAGRLSEMSVQLNRLLEKCLKDSKAIDLESLCIKMNEKVWAFRVDVNVLNHEGNILDCASVAALAALVHFRRPDVTCDGEEFTIHSHKQRDPIPSVVHHYPVCITYGIFKGGDYVLADPSLLEEGVADAYLSVGLNSYKELCGFHLGGNAVLTPDIILQTAQKAASRAGAVVQQIKEAVEEDIKKREERQPIGFHRTIDINIEMENTQKLDTYLDQWSTQKKGRRKMKQEKKLENTEVTAKVESLGKGSAVLLPTEKGDNTSVWTVSSSEEEEIPQVPVKKEKHKKIKKEETNNSGSEEEKVVILGANKKNKKTKLKNK